MDQIKSKPLGRPKKVDRRKHTFNALATRKSGFQREDYYEEAKEWTHEKLLNEYVNCKIELKRIEILKELNNSLSFSTEISTQTCFFTTDASVQTDTIFPVQIPVLEESIIVDEDNVVEESIVEENIVEENEENVSMETPKKRKSFEALGSSQSYIRSKKFKKILEDNMNAKIENLPIDKKKIVASSLGFICGTSLDPDTSLAIQLGLALTGKKFLRLKSVMEKAFASKLWPTCLEIKNHQANLTANLDLATFHDSYTVKSKEIGSEDGIANRFANGCYVENFADIFKIRINNLYKKNRLSISAGREIKMCLVGDAGGGFCKLGITPLLKNNYKTSSWRNIQVICVYKGNDHSSPLKKLFGKLEEEFVKLTTVEVDDGEEKIVLNVKVFVTSDNKFLYSLLGHKGQCSNFPCIFCKVPKKQVWSTSRTNWERYCNDIVMDEVHGFVKPKMLSSFERSNIVIPHLLNFMGVGNHFVSLLAKEMGEKSLRIENC